MTEEEWRVIPLADGRYDVSNLGRVRVRKPNGVIRIKKMLNNRGYLTTRIHPIGAIGVHRLVAMVFCDGKENGPVVRHLDGNPKNNVPDNLAWGTPLENRQDTIRHGHDTNLNKTHCPNGHPYDETNTYVWARSNQWRKCRRCNSEAAARYKAKKARAANPN
jgi:hypothetical protein